MELHKQNFSQTDKKHENCSICITDFTPNDQIVELTCAGSHFFHVTCLEAWFRK